VKPSKHTYELPCKNCKALVKMSAERWLEMFEAKKLPLCRQNGCNRYAKFLSLEDNEYEYYRSQSGDEVGKAG
jgi:hypothetical protein